MRKINVVVTDDIALRQKQDEDKNFDPRQTTRPKEPPPTKKQHAPPSAEEALFGDFF